ncbi:hypothetical protein [Aureispira anguillae]|uniref:Uncharacterized protein n=1 Tax=Aureispira anguillae TaxID=2864201 RepID=A0A915YDY7_9BACT|nr:hypothetical protein [Aureispira anguillae]BDS11338.1 hypothetical protein AsAng_0020500 [Aureispira anguillae]
MKLLIALFFFFFSLSLSAQNAYYNAKTVSNISAAEITTWTQATPKNLIQSYRSFGLIDKKVDLILLNNFSELLTFLATPFDPNIDNKRLLYQIDHYETIKKAVAFNQQKKIDFLTKEILIDVDATIAGNTGICKNYPNLLKAVYEEDWVTYLELFQCVSTSKRAGLYPLYKEVNEAANKGIENGSVAGIDIGDVFGAFSNVSGANFTSMLIDATAQFLVERTQKELSIAFFDKFKKQLEKYPETKAFFPAIYGLLEGLMDFKEPSVGKAWTEAFSADIIALPKNFESFVLQAQTEPYRTLKTTPEFQYTRLAYHAAEKIIEGTNAADLITYLNTFYPTLSNADARIKNALQVAFVLSKNIRCKESMVDSLPQIWIHPSDLIQLDFRTKKYFLGLIYQGNKPLISNLFTFANDTQIQASLLKINSFLVICENIQKSYSDLAKIIKDTKKTKKEHLAAYLDYTEIAFQIVDYGFSVLPNVAGTVDYNDVLKPLMKDVLSILRGINDKNYAQVLAHSLKITNQLINLGLEKTILGSTNLNDIKRVKEIQEVLSQISFYGSFVVDIASADSSSKMKKVLRKYAAPVGSFKIKRNTAFSIDLNAYPGLYGGFEWTPEATTTIDQSGFAYGVTAPIGISLNWGSRRIKTVDSGAALKENYYLSPNDKWKEITGASNSIFLCIVDIGAALSYRWNGNSETNGFPDSLKFDQIFSPGLYYVHGFKNAPVSMMIGMQYTPLLRSIKQNDVILNEFNALRFGLSFVVDIPIFNLYRHKRRY